MPKDFKVLVKEEMAKNVVNALKSIEHRLIELSEEIFKRQLIAHPTYYGLSSGILGKHFGFVESSRKTRIATVADRIGSSLKVGVQINRGIGKAIAVLYMELNIDYDEISRFKEAITLNRNTETGEEQQLLWLNWLLTRGSGPIVMQHHILQGDFPGNRSRSKKAIMVDGGYWGVPSDFAGTEDNNWITQSMEETIDKLAEEAIILLDRELNA